MRSFITDADFQLLASRNFNNKSNDFLVQNLTALRSLASQRGYGALDNQNEDDDEHGYGAEEPCITLLLVLVRLLFLDTGIFERLNCESVTPLCVLTDSLAIVIILWH
jgi:hypothetical protein